MNQALLLKQCLLPAALGSYLYAFTQTVVVSDCRLNGWNTYTEPTGTLSFVNGPGTPPQGSGSLQIALGPNGDGKAAVLYNGLAGTPLSSLTQITYSTYVQSNTSGQAPALELAIDNNGDGTRDDQLVFEPVYQTGNYPGVIQNGGMVLLNTWQTWNGMTGGWWAASDETAGPSTYTLASYLAAHPTATIIDAPTLGGVILTGGGGNTWNNFIGNVDALTIGTKSSTVTFDFEACKKNVEFVTVCHKGRELSIPQAALQAHLNHGDQLGPCATTMAKSVAPASEALPERVGVSNYPNPFATTTRIQYSLPYTSRVSLKVYDAAGRELATLVSGERSAGNHTVIFQASRFGKGIYYYTLRTQSEKGQWAQTKSMTILR
jgi:hypothetical protein